VTFAGAEIPIIVTMRERRQTQKKRKTMTNRDKEALKSGDAVRGLAPSISAPWLTSRKALPVWALGQVQ